MPISTEMLVNLGKNSSSHIGQIIHARFQLFAEVDNYYGERAKGIPINTVTQRPKVLVKNLQTCHYK